MHIAGTGHQNPKPQRGGMFIERRQTNSLKPQRGDMCVDWGRHQKSSSIYGSFMNLRYANTGDSATVKDREFR